MKKIKNKVSMEFNDDIRCAVCYARTMSWIRLKNGNKITVNTCGDCWRAINPDPKKGQVQEPITWMLQEEFMDPPPDDNQRAIMAQMKAKIDRFNVRVLAARAARGATIPIQNQNNNLNICLKEEKELKDLKEYFEELWAFEWYCDKPHDNLNKTHNCEEYTVNGRLHRLNGPAFIWKMGFTTYISHWIYGHCIKTETIKGNNAN